MSTDSETFAQIMARRQKEAREQQEQLQNWSREVTERLNNERSTFMEEFTENDRRLFGVDK